MSNWQPYYAVVNNHYVTQVSGTHPLAVERYLTVLPGVKKVCVYGKKEEREPGFDATIKKYEYVPASVLKYQLASTVSAEKVCYRPFEKVDKRVFKEEMKRGTYEQQIVWFKELRQVVVEERQELETQMQELDKVIAKYDLCIKTSKDIVDILTDMINKEIGTAEN